MAESSSIEARNVQRVANAALKGALKQQWGN